MRREDGGAVGVTVGAADGIAVGEIAGEGVPPALFVGAGNVGRSVSFAVVTVAVAGGAVGGVGDGANAQPTDHSIEAAKRTGS